MATYALIHGAGDVGWYWHLVAAELRRRGHDVVAPDLPIDDDRARLDDYAEAVIDALGERSDLVVVGQSFGGYTAPLVCARVSASLMVLVAGMVPQPGESAEAMFAATGYRQADQEDPSDLAVFYHDVPTELANAALSKGRPQSQTTWSEPWPKPEWPTTPVRYVLCRNDRLFPPSWTRRVVRARRGSFPTRSTAGIFRLSAGLLSWWSCWNVSVRKRRDRVDGSGSACPTAAGGGPYIRSTPSRQSAV